MKHLLSILLVFIVFADSYAENGNKMNDPSINKTGEKTYQNLVNIPLNFTENKGQWKEEIKFSAHAISSNAQVHFDKKGVHYSFQKNSEESAIPFTSSKIETFQYHMNFTGANEEVVISGVGEQITKTNYLLGNNPAHHHVNLSNYSAIIYHNLYDNIDLKYYGTGKELKYDFIINPDGKVEEVRMRFEQIEKLEINKKGELEITTKWGTLIEKAPYSYQKISDQEKEVDIVYHLIDKKTVGFKLQGEYDQTKQIIIDPIVLQWSTFVGGFGATTGHQKLHAIALDPANNVYAVGETQSNVDFATAGAHQTLYGGGIWDAFVFKLSNDGTTLVYSTYLGGSEYDTGFSISVDASGNAYITGVTNSNNFPVTASAYQTTPPAGQNTFISKLNPTGSALLYSTYLGGSPGGSGFYHASEINKDGMVYVTGNTNSANFPTTAGAYQTVYGGGGDAFFSVLNPLASGNASLVYSTYIGGSVSERGVAIDVDTSGSAYIVGSTNSLDFPVSADVFQNTRKAALGLCTLNNFDGFVLKIRPLGAGLQDLCYSSYIGGTNADWPHGIIADNKGYAYIAGYTNSTDFPTTLGVAQNLHAGANDVFVCKIDTNASSLLYSTFIGGADEEALGPSEGTNTSCGEIGGKGSNCIGVNSAGEVYISGHTSSLDFPTSICSYQVLTGGGVDIFVCKLSANGDSLLYSTYIGGVSSELYSSSLRLTGNPDEMIIGGSTNSFNFPVTPLTFPYQIEKSNGALGYQPVVFKFKPSTVLTTDIVQTNISCFGADDGSVTVNVSGGIEPYTYEWFPSGGTGSTASNLAEGTYFVNVADFTGCTWGQATAVITQPSALNVSLTSKDVKCNGENNGYALATASGGTVPYSYEWNTSPSQLTDSATELTIGTYTVTITDDNNCTVEDSVIINEPSLISSNVTVNNNPCGGSACVTSTGGMPPYSYLWSLNNHPDSCIDNLSVGTYSIKVTDSLNCSLVTSVSVNSSAGMLISIDTITHASCNGLNDGTVSISVSGGKAPYYYEWYPFGGTGAMAANLSAGEYTCTVTDSNGCIKTLDISITQPSAITAISAPIDAVCNGDNGSASVTPSGGTPPYKFSWTPLGGSESTANNLAPGNYACTITDSGGCSSVFNIVITEPDPLILTVTDTTPICSGQSATLEAMASGGTPPYTFKWSPIGISGSSVIVSPSDTTNYTVTVTDLNGCTGSPKTITINVIPNPVSTFEMTPSEFASLANPSISLTNQSTGGDSWLWYFGDSDNSQSNLKDPSFTYSDSGAYKVTLIVSTPEGCADTSYKTIFIESEYTFYIPNAFSPDNDGLNDFFGPVGIGFDLIEQFTMTIFNRWGEKIYQSLDIEEPWDGKLNKITGDRSEGIQYGVYSYLIEVKASKKPMRFYSGNFTLIK